MVLKDCGVVFQLHDFLISFPLLKLTAADSHPHVARHRRYIDKAYGFPCEQYMLQKVLYIVSDGVNIPSGRAVPRYNNFVRYSADLLWKSVIF